MRLHALSPAVLLLTILTPITQAVFQDEAYQTDYQYALLGTPQSHTTFFHRPSAASKASLLYTLSEKYVLGAINPKDGAILWRQRLAGIGHNLTGSESYLRAGNGENTVISAVDGIVRAWDAADGRLVWEREGSGKIRGLEVSEIEGGSKDVLVLIEEQGGKGVIKRLKAGTGEVIWEFADERYAQIVAKRARSC